VTPACTSAQDSCLAHAAINAKNAHTPAQARPCNGAATSSPCKLLWHILQLELCPRNRQNLRQPMAQSQVHYHASIIWSSALVRAPSSLSMVRTRRLATEPIRHKILFPPLFLQDTVLLMRRLFLQIQLNSRFRYCVKVLSCRLKFEGQESDVRSGTLREPLLYTSCTNQYKYAQTKAKPGLPRPISRYSSPTAICSGIHFDT